MSKLAEVQWSASTVTPGSSEEADYVSNQMFDGIKQWRSSISFGEKKREATLELLETYEECKEADWDGFGAAPIEHDAYLNAYRFIEALPDDVATPEMDAEPDGHLTFGWHRTRRYTLSVSVSPDGYLYWSALLGPRKRNGSEPFLNRIPSDLLRLILTIKGA